MLGALGSLLIEHAINKTVVQTRALSAASAPFLIPMEPVESYNAYQALNISFKLTQNQ